LTAGSIPYLSTSTWINQKVNWINSRLYKEICF
jgi:hypothetical protein